MSLSDAEKKRWLESSGEQRCALFELRFLGAAVGSPAASHEYKAYVSNGPYATGPSDSPSNQVFEDCVLELPSFTRRMGEQLNGRSTQSYGDLIIANGNIVDGQVIGTGERSAWLSMNWDGRRIRQWIGAPWWSFDDFILVLDGAIADVFDPGGNRIGFHISDKATLLDRPIVTTLLGGTGPNADKLIPYALGNRQLNVTPLLYDETGTYGMEFRITQVDYAGIVERLNEGSDIQVYEDRRLLSTSGSLFITAVDAGTDTLTANDHGLFENSRLVVFDAGSGIPGGLSANPTEYWVQNPTTNTFQLSATPGGSVVDITSDPGGDVGYSAKHWTMDYPNGGFWVASNPSGLVTCTCNGLRVGGVVQYSPGDIIKQVLTSSLTNTPLTSADIDATNFAAVKTLLGSGRQVAYYLTAQTTFAELFDRLMLSVGGWWGFSRDGLLQIGRLDLPVGGSSVYEYIPDDVALRSMKLQRRILPRAEVKLLADRNWTVQTVFAGTVSQDDRATYSKEGTEYTGVATVTDWQSDPTSHRNVARPDPVTTYLSLGGQSEADRRASLYQYVSGVWSFLTHQSAYLFEIGQELSIEHQKFTGDGVVVGISERIKGRSEIQFFASIEEVHPTANIPPPAVEIIMTPVVSRHGSGALPAMGVFEGNLLVVSTMGGDNYSTPTDTIGNTYIPLTSYNNGVQVWNRFFYCFSIGDHPANIITATVSEIEGNDFVHAVQFEGYTAFDNVDAGISGRAGTTLSTVTPFSSSAAGLILIASYHTGASVSGPGDSITTPASGPTYITPPTHTGLFYHDLFAWVTSGAVTGQIIDVSGPNGGGALAICGFK